ncbi:hypothetical protein FRC00_001503 [Tulasnella sp. 408]|nr:hypothetical protein FRC00_001503 [Tulasnella sp. 408]
MYSGHITTQAGYEYQATPAGHPFPPNPIPNHMNAIPNMPPPGFHSMAPQYPSSSPSGSTFLSQIPALDPTQGFQPQPKAAPVPASSVPKQTEAPTLRRSPRKQQPSGQAETEGGNVTAMNATENKSKSQAKGQAKTAKKVPAAEIKPKAQRKSKKPRTEEDKIKELDEQVLKDIRLKTATPLEGMTKRWTAPELLAMVEYICEPKRWMTFKVKQAVIFREIAANIVSAKTNKQIRDKWNTVFKMYKIVVRKEKHPGGRDGDEERLNKSDKWSEGKVNDGGGASDVESGEESVSGYDGDPLVDEQLPQGDTEDDGPSTNQKDKGKKKKPIKQKGFSEKQLEDFRNGNLYPIIDAVYIQFFGRLEPLHILKLTVTYLSPSSPNTSPDVDRKHTFSSAIKADEDDVDKKPSRKRKSNRDDAEENVGMGSNAVIDKALAGIGTHHQENYKLRQVELDLAIKREKREEHEAKKHEQREAEKHNIELWDKVERWKHSDNPALRAKARKMAEQLMAEEGITLDT